jgi:hypothetical protein
MKQYLLSLYQPEGDPPAPEVLETIMGDLEVWRNPEPSIPLAVELLAALSRLRTQWAPRMRKVILDGLVSLDGVVRGPAPL